MDLFSQVLAENNPPSKKSKNFNTNTDNNPVWLTPPKLIQSLGVFDLDPCSPMNRPWDTAKKHYTEADNGLIQNWVGRVWMNPPYGPELGKWLQKMSQHLNGTALIYGRTDTKALHEFMFPFAESILFMEGRVKFFHENGIQAKSPGNAPSLLIGYDEFNSEMIEQSGIKGHHVYLKQRIFIAGISFDNNKTWRVIVGEALEELQKEAALSDIYETVIRLAPNRIKTNPNYKAKVRQTLQMHYERIATATYKLN